MSGPVKSDQMYRTMGELEKKFVARLDASDKAVELLHADQVRVPTMLDREIKSMRDIIDAQIKGAHELVMERFVRVDTMFTSLATLTDKLSLANATALTAALSAAEKAVGEQNRSSSLAITKSEQGMLEALKQLQQNFQTEIKAITSVIVTLQSRLDRGEGVTNGGHQQRQDAHQSTSSTVALVAVGIAAVSMLVTILMAVIPHAATLAR